jgi:hypothetical protein
MKKIIFISVFMFFASISVLNAQTTTPKITSRQVKQQDRIEQGTDNKELTRSETARLEREQKRIQIEKKMAKSDGTVTPKERRFLKREQNRASRDIYKQKHDSQVR